MSGPDKLPEERTPLRKRMGCWLITSVSMMLILAIAGMAVYAFVDPIARRALVEVKVFSCGLAFQLYAHEHNGLYPPLSSQPGKLMVDADTLYPEYMTDYEAWTYPEDPMPGTPEEHQQNPAILVDDHSYFYLGYVILDEREARAFAEAYKKRIAKGGDFTEDLKVPPGKGNAGSDTIFRLRTNIEHVIAGLEGREDDGAYARELSDRIPVIMQRPEDGLKKPIVYRLKGTLMPDTQMDRFPYSPEMVDILRELDALGK